ncbi:DUF3127 domain-containing protein [Hymenobacter koreensis]|uniref:DUF3127 domain-containing protein n=1 Tax=Hymenobacter koreensis TaxID=1084523 RepID=A0ABP8JK10_9BACT
MSNYTATGRLHEMYDTQQVSEKFSKREFVIEIKEGQYPEHIKFQLVQDKTALIDGFRIGDEITVNFNLRGRGFVKNNDTLYFTNLEAWKIEGNKTGQRAGGAAPQKAAPIKSDDDNDLPF